MKITFEGKTLAELTDALEAFLQEYDSRYSLEEMVGPKGATEEPKPVKAAPPPEPPKPKVDAAERMAKARAAKTAKAKPKSVTQYDRQLKEDLDRHPIEAAPPMDPMPHAVPDPEPMSFEDMQLEQPEPEEVLDPIKLTAIRVKTTEDLQAAYASGKHTQVLGLLKKYGNGAKSFRELQLTDFVPIRRAIDEGALG